MTWGASKVDRNTGRAALAVTAAPVSAAIVAAPEGTRRRSPFACISFLVAVGCLAVAPPVSVLASAPPASAQALPPCGSKQLEASLDVDGPMYATHTYTMDFDVEPTPASDDQTARNVQVTGPAGAVRKVSVEDGQVVVAPQAAGTLPLTVSWDQRGPWHGRDPEPSPWCSASTTLDLQVHEPVPITIEPWSRGRSAIFESYRRNGFGIVFKLAPAALPQNEHFPDPVDLTQVRVEARAVAGAKRPGPAVEPAVLEHVPGAKRPRRAQRAL